MSLTHCFGDCPRKVVAHSSRVAAFVFSEQLGQHVTDCDYEATLTAVERLAGVPDCKRIDRLQLWSCADMDSYPVSRYSKCLNRLTSGSKLSARVVCCTCANPEGVQK